MGLFDQHVHSRHSFDSRADPSACVETALARGLAGLTFTEHLDTHPDEWRDCVYNDEAYSATIRDLRTRFGDRIFIGKGIEVCYQPERMGFIQDFLAAHRFDVVLLSVHYFGPPPARPVHVREHWQNLDPETGTRLYLEHVLEAATFCAKLHGRAGRVFDVLGHLDMVKRYTQRFLGLNMVSLFPDLTDEILRACLAADLVPEVNTSSLRQGLEETMPGDNVVRRYAELGGRAMSLGSDAHPAESVGAGFPRALAALRAAGIAHIAVYQERRKTEVPIDGTQPSPRSVRGT